MCSVTAEFHYIALPQAACADIVVRHGASPQPSRNSHRSVGLYETLHLTGLVTTPRHLIRCPHCEQSNGLSVQWPEWDRGIQLVQLNAGDDELHDDESMASSSGCLLGSEYGSRRRGPAV